MNKKSKVIVSIVGITIVLLALLGITYAYYLTRIEGNTNTNSISITTADLKLVYSDGNGIITANNIMPGDTVGTKIFTVTNKGNTTIDNYGISLDYAEIVKDNKIVVPSIFERPEDFEITLTCKDNNDDDCNGYTGKFNNESIIMTTSSIEPDEVHNYSLTIHYANPDIDQSNDMGKNLNLKVNIFSVNESADINGTITGVDSTYALKVNSEPKLSTIVNGKYKLKGLEVGTHTLSIIDNNGNVVKSQKLVIETGDNPGISETTVDNETVPLITINENSRVAPLNTTYDKTSTTITNTGTTMIKFNPYESNKNSLAYNIINNALATTEEENLNGYAMYTDEPVTPPGKSPSSIKFSDAGFGTSATGLGVSDYTEKYWVYGTGYELDEETGLYSLTGVNIGKYADVYKEMRSKQVYLISHLQSTNSADTIEEAKKIDISGSSKIYKVSTSTSINTIYLYSSNYPNIISINEATLTPTEDDYGTSYYYRGNVKDNFVTFSGMCWRIVRIMGNGGIKLALADENYPCSENYVLNEDGTYSGYSTENGLSAFVNGATNISYSSSSTAKPSDVIFETSLLPNKLLSWSNRKDKSLDFSNLMETNWCNDVSIGMTNGYAQHSSSYKGLFDIKNANPTLKCDFVGLDNTYSLKYKNILGILTADETAYAGATFHSGTIAGIANHYLRQNAFGNSYFTMSANQMRYTNSYASLIAIYSNGLLGGQYAGTNTVYGGSYSSIRPVIVLKSNILASGDGTQSNPYVVE